MKAKFSAVLVPVLFPAFIFGHGPDPEDLAFWLEQVPGTTDVLVVGSWAVHGLQGWEWGVCHDPNAGAAGEGEYGNYDCSGRSSAFVCTDDFLTLYDGRPPVFYNMNLQENGITQGMVIDLLVVAVLDARDRFEMLRISYTVYNEPLVLSFCETLGSPRVANVMVFGGALLRPAVQDGLTLSLRSPFVRGDTNTDGSVDIGDAVFLLKHLFRGTNFLTCRAAGDANGDGLIDLADGIAILGYLFRERSPLPPPFPECGPARESDVDCITFPPCP